MHPKVNFGEKVLQMSKTIKTHDALRSLWLTSAVVVAASIGFMVSASTVGAGEVSVRGASCTLVRYYVAIYSVPAAEAWARSKGATDAEVQTARRCIVAATRKDELASASN